MKWAKTPEVLRTDIQANIYAAVVLSEHPLSGVRLQWTYGQTKGAIVSKPVKVTMMREDVGTFLAMVDGLADEMDAIHKSGKRALDLLPNANACEAYGGCPNRHLCNLSPNERIKSIMAEGSNDFLAQLRARQAATASVGVNPPEGNTPTAPIQSPTQAQEMIAAGVAPAVPVAPVAQQAPVETSKRRGRPSKGPEKSLKMLFLDCLPDRASPRASTRLEAAANRFSETAVVDDRGTPCLFDDYRLVPFGRGTPIFLEIFREVYGAAKPVTLYLDTRGAEASVVLSFLESEAELIVRGLR